jgi:hypothetical protein
MIDILKWWKPRHRTIHVHNNKPVTVETNHTKCCEKCSTADSDEWYGEELNGKIVYWCGKCYKLKVILEIHNSPQGMVKYLNIYGKTPEEVILK